MHVYYVPGMRISTLHSLCHLIFRVSTITPILLMEKSKGRGTSQTQLFVG